MQCEFHQEVEAAAICPACGRAICRDCAVNVAGELVCRPCSEARAILEGAPQLPLTPAAVPTWVPTSLVAPPPAADTTVTNALGGISLLLGLLGAVGCLCGGSIGGLVFGLPAIITGWLAHVQNRRIGRGGQDEGVAVAGIVLGVVEVLLALVVLLLVGSVLILSLLPGRYGD